MDIQSRDDSVDILIELALNLRSSCNHSADDLWVQIDPDLWRLTSNPWSMPSWEVFDEQPREYRDEGLPPAVTARVAVEQASTLGSERYVTAAAREQLGRR